MQKLLKPTQIGQYGPPLQAERGPLAVANSQGATCSSHSTTGCSIFLISSSFLYISKQFSREFCSGASTHGGLYGRRQGLWNPKSSAQVRHSDDTNVLISYRGEWQTRYGEYERPLLRAPWREGRGRLRVGEADGAR